MTENNKKITIEDIKSVTPKVLERLAALADLPKFGTVGGQAVASLFYEELGLNITGPVNDIDIFINASVPRRMRGVYNDSLGLDDVTFNNLSLEKEVTTSSNTGKQIFVDYSHYGHVDFISSRNYVDILRTYRDGLINYTLTGGAYCRDQAHTDAISMMIINGFDINAVQVGINLTTNNVLVSNDFLEFINTGVLSASTSNTPLHTMIRVVDKYKSGQFTGITCDLDKQINILAAASRLQKNKKINASYWPDLSPDKTAFKATNKFGKKYKNLADKNKDYLPPIIELKDNLYTIDLSSIPSLKIEELFNDRRLAKDNEHKKKIIGSIPSPVADKLLYMDFNRFNKAVENPDNKKIMDLLFKSFLIDENASDEDLKSFKDDFLSVVKKTSVYNLPPFDDQSINQMASRTNASSLSSVSSLLLVMLLTDRLPDLSKIDYDISGYANGCSILSFLDSPSVLNSQESADAAISVWNSLTNFAKSILINNEDFTADDIFLASTSSNPDKLTEILSNKYITPHRLLSRHRTTINSAIDNKVPIKDVNNFLDAIEKAAILSDSRLEKYPIETGAPILSVLANADTSFALQSANAGYDYKKLPNLWRGFPYLSKMGDIEKSIRPLLFLWLVTPGAEDDNFNVTPTDLTNILYDHRLLDDYKGRLTISEEKLKIIINKLLVSDKSETIRLFLNTLANNYRLIADDSDKKNKNKNINSFFIDVFFDRLSDIIKSSKNQSETAQSIIMNIEDALSDPGDSIFGSEYNGLQSSVINYINNSKNLLSKSILYDAIQDKINDIKTVDQSPPVRKNNKLM